MDTENILEVSASKENTVDQIIRHVFYQCKNVPELKEKITLPYNTYKGYELRITFDGEAIYDMQPLGRNRKLEEINLDTVSFCANKDYIEYNSFYSSAKKANEQQHSAEYKNVGLCSELITDIESYFEGVHILEQGTVKGQDYN